MHENRLARETSPYLLQHARNPVDWYPWGPEAFEAARRAEKPILLSIGYSACHWCHVMEKESFENESIARLMNENFVSVKVDREERPDLDEIYMTCVQMMTGHGGWPMTVFLTPDGEPFYGGTYFPPEDRHGMPGFPRVLLAIAEAYREKPDAVRETAGKLIRGLETIREATESEGALDESILPRAAEALARAWDPRNGGLGGAPKFPNTMPLAVLLRAGNLREAKRFLDMTLHTLERMAAGGIHDHLGGGFHRYTVDERWLVPHFEKMLYDNVQLVPLYVDAWRASGDDALLEVARDALAYLEREMQSPEGGFYSTQDADSEGEEGKFFVWTPDEVHAVLGEGEASEVFQRVYDVTDVGNFEGKNILHRTIDDATAGRMFAKDPKDIAALLAEGRRKLFFAREKRVRPFRDEKILTAWNGLAISAFADAWRATGDGALLDAARRAMGFVEEHLRDGDRLLHTWKDGRASIDAFLDDWAALGLAHLDLLEATFDARHLDEAARIGRVLLERFADHDRGGFFTTSSDHEELIARMKPATDGSVPSGTSLATWLCLRLATFLGETAFREAAERTLRLYAGAMRDNPFGHAHLIAAADFAVRGPREVVVVARGGAGGAAELLGPLGQAYVPNRAIFCYDPDDPPGTLPTFARDKPVVNGTPTAYVCHRFTCSPPVTDREGLVARLRDDG